MQLGVQVVSCNHSWKDMAKSRESEQESRRILLRIEGMETVLYNTDFCTWKATRENFSQAIYFCLGPCGLQEHMDGWPLLLQGSLVGYFLQRNNMTIPMSPLAVKFNEFYTITSSLSGVSYFSKKEV